MEELADQIAKATRKLVTMKTLKEIRNPSPPTAA